MPRQKPVAVVTTSVYRGLELFEEVTLPSLASQAFKDFVFYFFDGHFEENAERFAKLASGLPFESFHLPLLHATHYPHAFKWEPYNSALLVVKEPIVFRWGMYRRFHPKAVAVAASWTESGRVVDFSQQQMGPAADLSATKISSDLTKTEATFAPACGMFCATRQDLIEVLNGNDEVGLHWLHFEDVEMGARSAKSGLKMIRIDGWMDRFWHDKPYAPQVFPPEPQPDWSEWKPAWFKNREMGTFKTIEAAERETGKKGSAAVAEMLSKNGCRNLSYRGYSSFWYCEEDGSLIHADPWGDEYRDWAIGDQDHVRSIVGLGGLRIGRNLASVDAKLRGVANVLTRCQIVAEAWGSPETYVL